MAKPPEKPVCENCGSDDVSLEGTASWDNVAQDWVLGSTHDQGFCNTCDTDSYFTYVKLTVQELVQRNCALAEQQKD